MNLDELFYTVPTTSMDWTDFDNNEITRLETAILRMEAIRGTRYNQRLNRFAFAYVIMNALVEAFGRDFLPLEAKGGPVDAEWTRNGKTHRISLKTQRKRSCRPSASTKKDKDITTTISVHNTQKKELWTPPNPPAYDFMMVIGIDPRGHGVDIAIIPEQVIRDHYTLTKDQVQYKVEKPQITNYHQISPEHWEHLWSNHIAGPWSPDRDQRQRAWADRIFDEGVTRNLEYAFSKIGDGILPRAHNG